MKGSIKAYSLLILATIIWGLSPICGRVLKDSMSPFLITSLRFLITSVILFSIMYLKGGKKAFRLNKKDALILFIMGFFGIFMHNVLLFWALHYTAASNAALIESIGPTITSILAFLFLGERLSSKGYLGLLISFIGAVYLITNGSINALISLEISKADLVVTLCEFFWSLYVILSWKLSKGIDGLSVTAWTAFVGAVMASITGFVLHDLVIYQMNLYYLSNFLVLTLLAGVIAFLAWNVAISHVGASKGGSFVYLIPVFGAIFGHTFLGEPFNLHKTLGGIIVVLGMFLCMRSKSQSKATTSIENYKKEILKNKN